MSSQPGRPTASLILRQTGQRYRLTQSPITLGRHPSNTIVLADPPVSRHHARILFQAGTGWALEDLDSANGTFVNGQRLARPRRLRHGDTIQIGPSILDVQIAVPAPASRDVTQPMPVHPTPSPLSPPTDYDEDASLGRSGTNLLPLVFFGVLVVLALAIGLTLLLVRGVRGNPAPTVAILSPASDSPLAAGESTSIQISAQDDLGVTRIELTIDGRPVSTTTSTDARGDPTLSASQTWRFDQLGSHSISAVAYDARGAASSPAVVVVNVVASSAAVTATARPTDTRPPPPTQAPTATDTPVVIIATATPSATPTPTPTPTSTSTPTPSPTPTPSLVPLPTIEYFRVVPTTVSQGECATLQWGKVENATRAEITPGIGGVGTPGSTEVCPTSTVTYTLTATGPSGVTTQETTLFVEAAPRPDLTIGTVAYDPDPPVANGNVVVSITLRNVGLGAAGPFRWEYQAGTYPVLGGEIADLSAGATVVVTGTWQPETWYTNLPTETRVDPDNDVLETNEENNTFAETIQVLPAVPTP
jgi:hypothetical protein